MSLWPVWGSAVALCWLALSDIRQRRLPNAGSLLVCVLYGVHWQLSGQDTGVLLGHIATALGALLLFVMFYALHWMAGGDVKLAASVFLWAGPEHASLALAITGVAGTGIALAQLLARPYVTPASVWHASRGTPYGVALAAGGLWAVWRHVANGTALF